MMRLTLPAGRLLAALALGLAAAAPLAAPAVAQDLRPVVLVNDRAITRYELDQRLRFMQALRSPGDARTAETALINERLQIEEGRRMGIVPSEAAIQAGMTEFAARGNMDAATFTAELGRAGVDAQTFRDFVTAGVVWRQVLRDRVAPNVTVSDREITQARKRAIEQPRITEVLISELIIPAPPGREAAVTAQAEEIARSVGSEAQFAAAARRYSATRSAPSGGRLPWTPIAKLPQGLAPILLALQPGQVTQPLTIPGAVVLFYLRDTRGVQRPNATGETLEYLRLTVDSAAEAAAVQARAETCEMLYVAARGRPVEKQSLATGQLPADVAIRLAALDPNESVIVDRGGAADVLMLCKRTPTVLAEADAAAALPAPTPQPGAAVPVGGAEAAPAGTLAFDPPPTAGAARETVFNRKVNEAAEALLAELRANAIIRRP